MTIKIEKYLYQEYISDLNGIDTKAHGGIPENSIKIIRDWLYVSSGSKEIDGHKKIIEDYRDFRRPMPEIANKTNLDLEDLAFTDYRFMVEETLRLHMN